MNIATKFAKAALTASIIVGAVTVLTACGVPSDASPGDEQGNLVVRSVELPSGSYVNCVASKYTANAVAPSCDWSHIYEPTQGSLDNGNLYAYGVDLPDGREVICVASSFTAITVYPSCDWENSTEAH